MKTPNYLPAFAKTTSLLAILLSFFHLPLFAQATFQNAFGVEGFDKGVAIRQLADGGFIIGGETQSYGLEEKDILLTRTDAAGNVEWTKSYGGPEREIIADLLQMPDEGLLLLAERYQPNLSEGEFLTLAKTDSRGNLLWKKVFDEGGKETEGFSISPTPDGNYIIAGLTRDLNIVSTAFYNVADRIQKVYLLKVDPNGNKLWSRYLKVPGIEGSTASSVVVARDGSYMVTGNIASMEKGKPGQGMHNLLVLRVNPDGTLAWAKEYKGNRVLGGTRIRERKDGGFVIAGVATASAESNIGYCVMNIAADGTLQWAKTIGGKKNDNVTDIVETPDGGYMVYGCTESYGAGGSDLLFFRMSRTGDIRWAKTYGRELSEYSGQLVPVKDGFVLTGHVSMGTESYDVLLLKTNAEGGGKCWGSDFTLTASPLQVSVRTLPGAVILPVEPGKNPNYKKANTDNIVQQNRNVRTKDICQ